MVTKDDLKLVDEGSLRAGNVRNVVEYNGQAYIVGASNIDVDDEDTMVQMIQEDPDTVLMLAFGMLPPIDTYVMEAKLEDGNWVPKNECGEHCKTGVCNKRLASDFEVGSLDHGYDLLLDYLNA